MWIDQKFKVLGKIFKKEKGSLLDLGSRDQILKKFLKPVIFDVTHSLQLPGGLGSSTDGRREFVLSLAKAGISQSIAGLFLEAHPNPNEAKCDGPCALPLASLDDFLRQIKDLDDLVKNQEDLVF